MYVYIFSQPSVSCLLMFKHVIYTTLRFQTFWNFFYKYKTLTQTTKESIRPVHQYFTLSFCPITFLMLLRSALYIWRKSWVWFGVVKLNGSFYTKCCGLGHLCFAQKGRWNWPLYFQSQYRLNSQIYWGNFCMCSSNCDWKKVLFCGTVSN